MIVSVLLLVKVYAEFDDMPDVLRRFFHKQMHRLVIVLKSSCNIGVVLVQ